MSFKEYPKKNLNVYFVSFASTLDPGHTIVEKFVPIVAEIKGLKQRLSIGKFVNHLFSRRIMSLVIFSGSLQLCFVQNICIYLRKYLLMHCSLFW